ncbi:MAG: zinc-ribbon domain-containing protein [Deltaproteobacteria bacterium]|nr:zinc-ribbon domain-containing protein [Deltaproteobacteria bacterium]
MGVLRCSNCGEAVPETQARCPRCGAEMPAVSWVARDAPVSSQAPPAQVARVRVFLVAIAAALLLMGAAMAMFFIQHAE